MNAENLAQEIVQDTNDQLRDHILQAGLLYILDDAGLLAEN